MAISNKPFPTSSEPYKGIKSVPKATSVDLPNLPPRPAPEPPVVEEDDEPHPEHIAGQKAVEHYSAKFKAEQAAGEKALARKPR